MEGKKGRLTNWFTRLSRGKKIALCISGVIICLAASAGFYVTAKLGKVKREVIPKEKIVVNDLEEDVGVGYTNFAVFGVDSREGEMEKGTRTDCLIVASLNNETKEVRLVSVYRDSFLDLSDGTLQKCNAAYSYGGAEQAINMLNMNLDLDIQDFVTVDFTAVSDVVDLLGGIEIEIQEEEVQYINEFIDEGLIEDRGFSEKKSALYSLDLRNASYYYGTLESLYANLLTPKENPGKFWRLINFYWSAFFSIVFPLLEGERGFDACPNLESKYSYVLNNLNWIVERLWSEDYLDDYGNGNSYYSAMRGAFDYVLITNYTPVCRLVLKGEADERKRTIYLAGSLAQFESAVSFDTFDLSECGGKKGIADIEVPFPFLMTRSPIKPIINTCQLRAYSAALGALDQCDELVVLGYSFSDDDAHIAAIVRDYLRNGKMTYFAYSSNEQLDLSKIYSDLAKRLRVDETYLRDCCEIRRVKNYKSKGFSQKIAELKMKKNGERP